MSTIDVRGNETGQGSVRELRKTEEVVAGGASAEAIGGAAAVVLGILGLARIFPHYMAAVAAIAVGAALILEGAAIAARYHKILRETAGPTSTGQAEVAGGFSTEFLGGAAGIVLGILSLLGIASMTLLAVAAIIFGGTLLLSSGTLSRLNAISLTNWGAHPTAQEAAREAVMGAAGTQVLVSLGAIVLGILALVGFQPMLLTLVAFLSVGGSLLLSGSALTARMLSLFSR